MYKLYVYPICIILISHKGEESHHEQNTYLYGRPHNLSEKWVKISVVHTLTEQLQGHNVLMVN